MMFSVFASRHRRSISSQEQPTVARLRCAALLEPNHETERGGGANYLSPILVGPFESLRSL